MISKKYVLISCILLILLQGITETVIATPVDRNVIIGFRHTVGQNDDKIVQSHGGLVKKNFHIIPAIAATIPENRVAELKNDPNVLYVENETIYKIADEFSDEYNNSWGVQHIGSESVNGHGINGTGVKIAILDTGIDYTNIDLKDNYKGGFNFVSNNTNPYDDNCLTLAKTCHGTHVSGIAAAERNGIGVVGVAPNASIYAVKVLDATGFGSTSWVLSGIQWAVDNNMNIVSMSFSGDDDIAVHAAIDVAYQDGILLVAAAGNTYGGNVTFPAGYDSVIAVTATDNSDNNAYFSPIDPKIELAAPGVNINSTIGSTINGGYGVRSGTSMAAPHVTGVAALIYSTNFPDVDGNGIKDNRDVRLILDNTARDLGIPGKDSIYGYGIVDAQNATLGIPFIPPPPPPPPPTFIPPDPINLQYTTGKYWVNYTWSPGIGNITDSYNVSVNGIWYNVTNAYENFTTVPARFVNITVWAFNSSGKGTLSTGSISQNAQIPIDLNLIRTNSTPINDSQGANLSQGNYLVTINNTNISELDMNVYDNGTIVKNLSQIFVFNNSSLNNVPKNNKKSNINYGNSNNVDINLNIPKSLSVVFVPYGGRGATCEISIKEV